MRCRLTMSLVVFSNGQPKQWMDGSLRARTRLSVRPRSNGSGAPGSARLSGGLAAEEGSGWSDWTRLLFFYCNKTGLAVQLVLMAAGRNDYVAAI